MTDALTELAKKHATDKWGAHYYTPHYHRFFEHIRHKSLRVFEIGVGGYERPDEGGESLRMWKEYFPNGQIVSIDIFDKSTLEEERIKIYRGSQTDTEMLAEINSEMGPFDIIIDDGSHLQSHIITSFEFLFPLLAENGIYVVEDLQTSYWKSFGGDSFDLRRKNTAMNYFKQLLDGLNHEEIENPLYRPNYFDENIVSMSFFHNIVFIQKGKNDEGSNLSRILRMREKPISSKIFRYVKGKLHSLTHFDSNDNLCIVPPAHLSGLPA